MRRLMIGVVALVFVLGAVAESVAAITVTGPAVLLPGFEPNPIAYENPTYLSPNGQFMIVYSSSIGDVGSRTWNAGTGQWGPVTAIPGITGLRKGFATLSPDGGSMFFGSTSIIQRSKLQSDGTWSAPQTIVSGSSNYWPYFNGHNLYFTQSDGTRMHIAKSEYNSSTDTFSESQIITSLDGPPGTSSIFPWVSQDDTDMIFDRISEPGNLTSDLYSAQWNGTTWGNVTQLSYVHKDLQNFSPCVVENAGKFVFTSAPAFGGNTTIWEAPITFSDSPVPEPSTLIIWSLLGGLGITMGWVRKRESRGSAPNRQTSKGLC